MMSRVWWGWRDEQGLEHISVGSDVLPQKHGGLGFRDIRLFNVALLGRQVWHLINCKNTLCYRVLSSKYFLDGDVFYPKSMDKPSYTWQSIAKAVNILLEGFGWNVGDGKSINIWTDNCGFEGLSGSSIHTERRMTHKNKVCKLFNESKDGWNENRVLELYGENMKDQICEFPILHNSHEDQRI
ncbi:hypothetical protein PVK06_043317 [Gossypium arboreum]|uniref:Reverse transcriptase n=1 Tax=Gossypium arboreum TaxID=29729 RepID=A0ABR0MNK2_GOSAR|nr:hypothetical protein PVK06_043317 [Gossypium arboreum]